MIKDFLFTYTKMLAQYPEKVEVTQKKLDDNFVEIIIKADKDDSKKLIGKDGKMINSIKTFILGYKAKNPTSYRITVKHLEE